MKYLIMHENKIMGNILNISETKVHSLKQKLIYIYIYETKIDWNENISNKSSFKWTYLGINLIYTYQNKNLINKHNWCENNLFRNSHKGNVTKGFSFQFSVTIMILNNY
jgi:hypothetical protein